MLRNTTMKLLFIALVLIGLSSCNCNNSQSTNYSEPGTHPMLAGDGIAQTSTQSGKVIGYLHKGIINFKGIPYAKAERFMPPEKPDAWDGVRSCRAYGPVCPINVASMILFDEMEFAQQHNFGYMNEKTCMNLNVWSPNLAKDAKRPVMVWLHGGGYTAGSSCELPSYDGENLARTGDVVVVSINHRLNVLGFLDLSAVDEKYAQSANVGMMDVVAALQWVHDNIENFGGDPANVTIFGQSGGGGKVATLLYTPSAKGLFHKAIMQSGVAGKYRTKEESQKIGIDILEELGLKKSEVDQLQTIPYDVLLEAGKKAIAKTQKSGFGVLDWAPSCDGTFIPLQPGDDGAEMLAMDVPLIIGSNQVEFGSFGNRDLLLADEATITKELECTYGDQTEAYIAAFKQAYPTTKLPSDMMDVDILFRPMMMNFATLRASVANAAPVYNYLFKWNAPHLNGLLKSSHCMELAFVFNNIERTEEYNGGTPEAYALANKISSAWASFAHTGNPNSGVLPEWTPFTPENGATMLFDNESEQVFNHDKELLKIAGSVKHKGPF